MNPTSAANLSTIPLSSPQFRFRGHVPATGQSPNGPRSVSQDEDAFMFDLQMPNSSRGTWDQGSQLQSASSSPKPRSESPASTPPAHLRGTRSVAELKPAKGPLPDAPPKSPARPQGALPAAAVPSPGLAWGTQGLAKDVAELKARMEVVAQLEKYLTDVYVEVVHHKVVLGNTASKTGMLSDVAAQKSRIDDIERAMQGQQMPAALVSRLREAYASLETKLQHEQQTILALGSSAQNTTARIEELQRTCTTLTEHVLSNNQDQFDALGQLPSDYLRIETATGPYALDNETQLKLQHCVRFSQGEVGEGQVQGRIHVNVSKELLANLATWVNGLSISEAVLGQEPLWNMHCYAMTQHNNKLAEAVSKAIHRAALEASNKVLERHGSAHPARVRMEAMINHLQLAMGAQRRSTNSDTVHVRVPLGASAPHLTSQPLFTPSPLMPEWRSELVCAFDAFTQYCKKNHILITQEPHLTVGDSAKEMALTVTCLLPS